jgi:hypothetical protein
VRTMPIRLVALQVKLNAKLLFFKSIRHRRRTFAKLAHRGCSPLEQIQLSLGHSSIVTTERYLGVRQIYRTPPAITWACICPPSRLSGRRPWLFRAANYPFQQPVRKQTSCGRLTGENPTQRPEDISAVK